MDAYLLATHAVLLPDNIFEVDACAGTYVHAPTVFSMLSTGTGLYISLNRSRVDITCIHDATP